MFINFDKFEEIVRASRNLASRKLNEETDSHPFDERNIHPEISKVSQKLFDNGHYSQATFEAFKFIDFKVKELSKINEFGQKLMMSAFSETSPKIQLTRMSSQSEIDEQSGFKFIFAGSMSAIRNPRGHDITSDPIDRCLDHLSLASVLLRRMDERVAPLP